MVNCGHVYFLYLPIAQKEKLVVPAFVDGAGRVRFFVINTNRTDYQIARPEVSQHVLAVPHAGHETFLNYDSWLACHEVLGGYTASQLDAKPDSYRGPLTQDVINAARNAVMQSRLLSEPEKAAILDQWPA
jgi:hypothetical protein